MTCSKTTTLDHRAFDTVSHNSLLNKMKCYGVDGNINNWLRDFLTNWTMQVVVNGESAEPASVDSVFSQGMVLESLLFLCHINDLPDHGNQPSDYLQTTASCTAVSDLCGTTSKRPTWTWEVGHEMGYAVKRQHVLCYEHKPEIKSLLSTQQSNPQTSRRTPIPRHNSFRRSQIKSTYQKHHQKKQIRHWAS